MRYTDVPGRFLASYILKDNNDCIENLFKDGIGLDGSSVSGFVDISESDLILLPDISTIRVIPPTATMLSHNIAAVISDVYRGFGQGRLSKDPRNVCQRIEGYLGENGLSCQIGSEVECFIFDDILFDNNNYFGSYRVMKLIVMNLKLYQQNNMERANILYTKREDTTHHHSKIP